MPGACLYTTNVGSNSVDRYTNALPPVWINSFALPADSIPGNPPVPDGIACAADGSGLWITDFVNSRVVKMSPDGSKLAEFGTVGSGPSEFAASPGPEGIAINPTTGAIYVCDRGNNRVQFFSSTGSFLGEFGTPYSSGVPSGEFSDPGGIAINPATGDVYVGDYTTCYIQRFADNGIWISTFGGPGTSDGLFGQPEGIAIDADENVWVTDCRFCVSAFNDRYQQFDSSGAFITQFAKTYQNDVGLAIHPTSGNLYTAVYSIANIIVLEPDGTLVTGIASHSGGVIWLCFGPCPGKPSFNNSVRIGIG